jgi:hypothetical protein
MRSTCRSGPVALRGSDNGTRLQGSASPPKATPRPCPCAPQSRIDCDWRKRVDEGPTTSGLAAVSGFNSLMGGLPSDHRQEKVCRDYRVKRVTAIAGVCKADASLSLSR